MGWGYRERAHPRSRGENWLDNTKPMAVGGSSPLTRGKPIWHLSASSLIGLIPAHAGKTSGASQPSGTIAAHPRSRGENWETSLARHLDAGSSPLTRGKPHESGRRGFLGRLIPAHAGKTGTYVAGCSPPAAHPRSRGENGPARTLRRTPTGSSPLTRGKPGAGNAPTGWPGLIPAHAGKTGPGLWEVRSRTAHPRSRGENR